MRRGAIVGFGRVAQNGHWPAYAQSPDAAIVAVIDASAERRREAQAVIPDVATFRSLEEVPKALAIDFADICTPPAFHRRPMLEAIEHDWHVLCEKPLVLDGGDLTAIRSRALERNVAVVPVHNWLYAPILRRVTAICRSGGIGHLRVVEIETLRTSAAAVAAADGNWRYDATVAGGGVLMDHGWHAIYLACRWFGALPIGVTAARVEAGSHAIDHEASVTIEFPSGYASLALSWKASARRNWMRLVGDAGELVVDDDTLTLRARHSWSDRFPALLSAGSHHAEWFGAMIPDVFACFDEPARAEPIFSEAAACLSVIEQAYQLAGPHVSIR